MPCCSPDFMLLWRSAHAESCGFYWRCQMSNYLALGLLFGLGPTVLQSLNFGIVLNITVAGTLGTANKQCQDRSRDLNPWPPTALRFSFTISSLLWTAPDRCFQGKAAVEADRTKKSGGETVCIISFEVHFNYYKKLIIIITCFSFTYKFWTWQWDHWNLQLGRTGKPWGSLVKLDLWEGSFLLSLLCKGRMGTAIKNAIISAFTEVFCFVLVCIFFLCKNFKVFMNLMYSCNFLMKVHFSRWLRFQKTISLSVVEYVLDHQWHSSWYQLTNYFRRKTLKSTSS